MTKDVQFAPDWVSPPGDTIEDLLEERGWAKAEFAQRTGFTTKHVNELVKGRAPISADAAERLSLVLGSTSDFWLARDARYQAAMERRRALEAAERDAGWLKELPVTWMCKQGWIQACKHQGAQVMECLRFFGVASVEAWRGRYQQPLAAFRTSQNVANKTGAVAAWLRRAEQLATACYCAPFDKNGFKGALAELRSLTNESDPEVFVPRLTELCAEHGVAVVFVPAPTGCPASGATRWLTHDKAMLVLSLRHRSNDQLWFTFFHEAAHLLLHGKKELFVDGVDDVESEREAEADRFASDWLIPPEDMKRLRKLVSARYRSKAQVREFAEQIGVAPGIVVARMHREELLPWTHMKDLKVGYTRERAQRAVHQRGAAAQSSSLGTGPRKIARSVAEPKRRARPGPALTGRGRG